MSLHSKSLLSAATLLFVAHASAETKPVLLEGEALPVRKVAGQARTQDLQRRTEAKWSGAAHLWWTGGKPGDAMELTLSVPEAGTYRLGAGFTKAIDYGIFDVALDEQELAANLDFFNNGVTHTGTLPLGEKLELTSGEHVLRFIVRGANEAAKKSYMLGLDYVVLAPGADADVAAAARPLIQPAPKNPPKAGGASAYNNESVKAQTPGEEQKRFTVPAGFEIELVASEETGLPKPTNITFDDAGRLWSATGTMYPCDNDPEIWKHPGKDRVLIFDSPTARTPQTPRVFADGMVMPLSILPRGRGAFIAQGPEIFFLDDKDGDGHADDRRVLLQGFGTQDTHTLPHQLTWMPGGRVVFSQGLLNRGSITDATGTSLVFNRTLVASIRPDGTDTRILSAGLNNIWAWNLSRTGRVFLHEANDLGYSVVPFEEDSSYPAFTSMRLNPNSPLHPPTAWELNLGGTGFSGLAVCNDLSGTFPAPWQGLIYIANPILGKIHAVAATLDERGVWHFEKRGDLVSCSDTMFRPVSITFGPDGCLYIADWYNRIISHNEIPRDHPARDKEHGRVWRVRTSSQPTRQIPDLTRIATAELPGHLQAASTWEQHAAWHQIGERHAAELAPALVKLAGDPAVPDDARIHALWSLEETGHFAPPLWKTLLAAKSADLRREAVRALSSLQVAEGVAFDLLQPLASEKEWTVRYEVLRYFRRAAGPVNPQHIAWLKQWAAAPAPKMEIKGWNGTYLALGGSYERAFQDFLLSLVETKSPAAQLFEPKWDKVVETVPPPPAEEQAKVRARIAAITALLPRAKPEDGRPLIEGTCMACHAIGGKGVSLGPPLDGSSKRDVEALLTSILTPDAAVEQVFRLYRIETKTGEKLEGFKKSETAQEITLLFMGGVPQSVPVAKIKTAGYVAGKSVMLPLAAAFTDQQIADLVAYLRTLP